MAFRSRRFRRNYISRAVSDLYHSRQVQEIPSFLEETILQVYCAVNFLYHSPTVRATLYENITQGWQGWCSSLRWGVVYDTVKNSDELYEQFKRLFFTNTVLYAAPVLAHEGWRWLTSRSAEPYSYPEMFFLSVLFISALIKNLSYSACIAYETAKLAPKEGFAPCEHGVVKQVKADAENIFYYPRNVLSAKFFGWLLGNIFFQLMTAMAFGQCIIDYRLSLDGTCIKDRDKLFRKNNPYVFMYGVSFMLMSYFFSFGMNHFFCE